MLRPRETLHSTLRTPARILVGATLIALSVGPALGQSITPLAPVVPTVAVPPRLGAVITRSPPAQPAATTQPRQAAQRPSRPLILLDSTIIAGPGLGLLNPQDIASIVVERGLKVPAKWRGLAADGFIGITLKPHARRLLKTESLQDIRKRLKLKGPVRYQLEGRPIDDPTLRIATAAIARLDVQPVTDGAVVDIHLAVPPPAVHPPGTILIRGVASS